MYVKNGSNGDETMTWVGHIRFAGEDKTKIADEGSDSEIADRSARSHDPRSPAIPQHQVAGIHNTTCRMMLHQT